MKPGKKKLLVKQFVCLQITALFALFAQAQQTSDYSLKPGPAASVSTGGTLELFVSLIDKNNTPGIGTIDNSEVWTINGHDMNHLTASDGNLKTDGMNFSKVTYTAPSSLPEKNPVIIQVRFPTKPGEKEMTILQCAVTITDVYKLTGDVTLSCALTNMDIQLHIEDFVRYTVLANGTAMLEPVEAKSTLHVKVEKGIMVNKNGALGKYKSPMEFEIPVLISIDKQGSSSSPATFYFKTFSPPGNKETYLITSNGASQYVTQNYINGIIGTAFVDDFANAAAENAQNGIATIDWAHRMEAIQKKKPEDLTAQDKADIAQMKALQQKVGTGNNPFSNVPISDSMTVGSNTQQNSTTQAPAIAVGNGVGELNVACTYNPSAKTVLEINKQGSDPGHANHVTIHIKIEK